MKLETVNFDNSGSKKIISDERIEEIISKFISDGFLMMEEYDILFQIIKYIKCTKPEASDVFDRMKELGMGICSSQDDGYSIRRFANMRGYISDSDLEQMNNIILEKVRKEDPKKAKFMEEYGVDMSTWSFEVTDEYEYELDA